MNVRTSVSDPLLVSFIEGLSLPGRLGLTMAPGKKGSSYYGSPWDRDLDVDLERLTFQKRSTVQESALVGGRFEGAVQEARSRLSTRQ
jgi:hypothetical protein